MPTLTSPKAPKQTFGRVSKLLDLFGFGASTPYNTYDAKNTGSSKGGARGQGFDQWYDDQLKDGKSFQERLGDWKEMVSYSPIAAAVRIITDECIQTEHSCPGTLWAEGGTTEECESINDLFQEKLQLEDVIRPQFWNTIVTGNNFEQLLLGPEGVHGWKHVPVDRIKRISDENKRLIGYDYQDAEPPEGKNAAVLFGSKNETERIWRPWDFIHMRMMSEDRDSEYGTSLLLPATQVYKKLRMAEDQMVTYRLQMQPSRFVFKLDVGAAPTIDIWSIAHEWANYLRSSSIMDTSKNTYERRYSPWALDDLIILPIRSESTTTFEKLDGDTEVPDITDVQFLLRMLAGMLNIPPEFLGVESEGGSSLNAKSALAIQDLRFQRSIKGIRAAVMQGYDRAARIHLALNNKDPFTPFRVKMSNLSALEAETQMELISAQADLADKLMTLGDNIKAPKEEWIRMVFTKFMPLPEDLVDIISIGAIMKNGVVDEHSPLPAGPALDMGSPDGGMGDNMMDEPPLNLPDLPPENSSNYQSALRGALNERRRITANYWNRYFEESRSYDRWKRRNKSLCESIGIDGVASLVKWREEKSKLLTEASKSFQSHPKFHRSFQNIVQLIEGYRPDFGFVKHIIESVPGSYRPPGAKTLAERFVPEAPKANPLHESVELVKKVRKPQ